VNEPNTLSSLKACRAWNLPAPLITVTSFVAVLTVTTGVVPAFFSASLSGRIRTTTCTDESDILRYCFALLRLEAQALGVDGRASGQE